MCSRSLAESEPDGMVFKKYYKENHLEVDWKNNSWTLLVTCSLPWNQDFCSTSFNNLHLFFPFASRFQLGWHSLHPVYPLINQYGSRVNSLRRLELTVVFIFLYLFVTFALYIYINRHDDRFCDKEITFKSIQDLKNTFQTPNMYDFGFVLLWEMWKVLSSVYCLPQNKTKSCTFGGEVLICSVKMFSTASQ